MFFSFECHKLSCKLAAQAGHFSLYTSRQHIERDYVKFVLLDQQKIWAHGSHWLLSPNSEQGVCRLLHSYKKNVADAGFLVATANPK